MICFLKGFNLCGYQHWNMRYVLSNLLLVISSKWTVHVRKKKLICLKKSTSALLSKTIHSVVEEFQMTGSLLKKIKIWKCYVLTEKKLGNTNIWIETSPREAVCQLAVQSRVWRSLANKTVKLLELCSGNNRPT